MRNGWWNRMWWPITEVRSATWASSWLHSPCGRSAVPMRVSSLQKASSAWWTAGSSPRSRSTRIQSDSSAGCARRSSRSVSPTIRVSHGIRPRSTGRASSGRPAAGRRVLVVFDALCRAVAQHLRRVADGGLTVAAWL